MYKKLYKSRTDVKIDGVCAGMANYLNVDPTVIRVLWVLIGIPTNFLALFVYFLCSVIIPREPEYYE